MKLVRALALTFVLVGVAGCKQQEQAPTGAGSAQAPGPGSAPGPDPVPGPGPTPLPASATGSGGATDDGLVIPPPAPRVGDRSGKVEDTTLAMILGEGEAIQTVKHTEEIREVLAVDGPAITKAKLRYVAFTQRQFASGAIKENQAPLVGKTFVVWREGAAIKATREDGSAPAADELAAVIDANKRFGLPSALDVIIASKTWMRGERVAFTPAELAQLNQRTDGKQGSERFVSMALTLTGVDGDVATFAMEMGAAITLEAGTLEMAVTGTVRFDVAHGRPLELGGRGPVTGDLGTPVKGTMTIKASYSY